MFQFLLFILDHFVIVDVAILNGSHISVTCFEDCKGATPVQCMFTVIIRKCPKVMLNSTNF